jgi:uncharacterized membrane protein YoaK (UPF0700 family)
MQKKQSLEEFFRVYTWKIIGIMACAIMIVLYVVGALFIFPKEYFLPSFLMIIYFSFQAGILVQQFKNRGAP